MFARVGVERTGIGGGICDEACWVVAGPGFSRTSQHTLQIPSLGRGVPAPAGGRVGGVRLRAADVRMVKDFPKPDVGSALESTGSAKWLYGGVEMLCVITQCVTITHFFGFGSTPPNSHLLLLGVWLLIHKRECACAGVPCAVQHPTPYISVLKLQLRRGTT